MKTPKEKKTIETRERAEVKDFKAAISEAFSAPQEQLCLIYAGKILKVHPYMFGPCRIGRQKAHSIGCIFCLVLSNSHHGPEIEL